TSPSPRRSTDRSRNKGDKPSAWVRSTATSAIARWSEALWRPAAFVTLLGILWWLVTAREWVAPYVLPSPGATWGTFVNNTSYLTEHTIVTTIETVLGFGIALVVGQIVAVFMVYSKSLEKTMYPIILFAQVIPKIAIAPLFVVWLGFGMEPK